MSENRNKYIGASEVGAVLGIDPFCTPLQLWGYKTGLIQKQDLSDNEAVEWGTRLERIVSQKFSEKNNVKLMAYKKRFYHPKYEFLTCELDNIIVGRDELVEIKTANAWAIKKWEKDNEIPAHYIAQVTMQLGLSGRRIGHIAVLIGGQRYIEKVIQFDEEFYNNIVQKCIEFWKLVQEKNPPMACADDNEALLRIYPNAKNEELIEAVDDLNTAIARRQELSMHIKNMEEEKSDVENKIKQVIGDNFGLKTNQYVVTWKPQSRITLDLDKIKSDGIYDKYTKSSSTRTLNIKLNKEA